jgi:hypothetical protein
MRWSVAIALAGAVGPGDAGAYAAAGGLSDAGAYAAAGGLSDAGIRSCLREQTVRVAWVADSTSRYIYEALTHIAEGRPASTITPDPTDTSIFFRIPPRGNESLLPAWASEWPRLPAGCEALPTQSKWAAVMRWTHGLLGEQREVCDCSPGGNLCCNERYENRIYRFERSSSYLAYFQALGDLVPVRGFVEVPKLAAYALRGEKPIPGMCPAGINRRWKWETPLPQLLRQIIREFQPTHLVLNLGHWIRHKRNLRLTTPWWVEIASALQLESRVLRGETKLIWRTHPEPVFELKRSTSPNSGRRHHTNLEHVHALFRAHNWSFFDAQSVVRRFQGDQPDSAVFYRDQIHLTPRANDHLSRAFASMVCGR